MFDFRSIMTRIFAYRRYSVVYRDFEMEVLLLLLLNTVNGFITAKFLYEDLLSMFSIDYVIEVNFSPLIFRFIVKVNDV